MLASASFMPTSRATTRLYVGLMLLGYIVTIPVISTVSLCEAYLPPSFSSSRILSTSISEAAKYSKSRRKVELHASNRRRFDRESDREKRKRDELEAKALQQELLSGVNEAERSRQKLERDIRDAEGRRRAFGEQASMGRNYIDDLRSGKFRAINNAKKFLDSTNERPSRLDLERERLEEELDRLKSRQKAQETFQFLTTYGGIAAALSVAAGTLNGNGDLGELGAASGLRQATSKYLSDLSANDNVQKIARANTANAVPMPYLDTKIEEAIASNGLAPHTKLYFLPSLSVY